MNKSAFYALILFPALLQALAACQIAPYQGEARDVKRKPQEGGVVAIPRKFRPEDRARAEDTMRTVCNPNAFKVLEEGEIVTGQEVTSNTRETNRANSEYQAGTLFGVPVMAGDRGGKDHQTSSTARNMTEWQITYGCEKVEKKSADAKSPKIKPIVVK